MLAVQEMLALLHEADFPGRDKPGCLAAERLAHEVIAGH